MARLPRLFRTRSGVPKTIPIAADIIVFWIISGDFLFYIDKDVLIRIASMYLHVRETQREIPIYACCPGAMINAH